MHTIFPFHICCYIFRVPRRVFVFLWMLQIIWGNYGRFKVNFTPTKRLKIIFQLIGCNFQMKKD
ncbi:hypothetical protein Gotur_013001 [Gossypium turneri]